MSCINCYVVNSSVLGDMLCILVEVMESMISPLKYYVFLSWINIENTSQKKRKTYIKFFISDKKHAKLCPG